MNSAALQKQFPALCKEPPWFGLLLRAYIFLDADLEKELSLLPQKPVCAPGCTACCSQPIPLSLAEGMGIKRYLALLPSLVPLQARPEGEGATNPHTGPANNCAHDSPWRCPFLQNGGCTVYPVRPFACRRFLVFTQPCAPGEDVIAQRAQDVHMPSSKSLLHAQQLTLPIYQTLGHAVPQVAGKDFFARHSALIQHLFSPRAI